MKKINYLSLKNKKLVVKSNECSKKDILIKKLDEDTKNNTKYWDNEFKNLEIKINRYEEEIIEKEKEKNK
jgi:hypothetical protein